MSNAGTFFAVVNPAAGGGRCRKLVPERWIACALAESSWMWSKPPRPARAPIWHGTPTPAVIVNSLPSAATARRTRSSTGFFHPENPHEPATLAFLPLGTGNSFLREFTDRGVDYAVEALLAGRSQPCDVLRLRHTEGVLHYINLLAMGFAADVATLRARRFSGWGELGYQSSIFISLGPLPPPAVSLCASMAKQRSTGGLACF